MNKMNHFLYDIGVNVRTLQNPCIFCMKISEIAIHSKTHCQIALKSYLIRPEIAEQVENTTDLPISKHELMSKFPELQHQIESLPDCWWHQHPLYRMNAIPDPQHDADLLHLYHGEEPAAESKEIVRNRVRKFFEWLHEDEQYRFSNIVVYSHCCTIFEMERILRGIPDHIQNHEGLSMPTNTEVRSFDLLNGYGVVDDVMTESKPVAVAMGQ